MIFFLERDMLMNSSYSSSSKHHLYKRQRHAHELGSPKNKNEKKNSSKLGYGLGILPTTCKLSLLLS
jgi:hypothetical protein